MKQEMKTLLFKKKVMLLFNDCVAKEKQAWKNPDNIIGEGRINDYVFSSEKIRENFFDIYTLFFEIEGLKKGITFNELNVLKNNQGTWTELNQEREFLLALAHAATLVKFSKQRKDWDTKEQSNPSIVLTKLNEMNPKVIPNKKR